MKLLVLPNHFNAATLLEALDLDDEEWKVAGIGDTLNGQTFSRIVIIGPMSDEEFLRWRLREVETHLEPGGHLARIDPGWPWWRRRFTR